MYWRGDRPISEDTPETIGSAQTNEDAAQIFVMNNYFGLGNNQSELSIWE